MDVTVQIYGLAGLDQATARVQKNVEAELAKALFATAKKVEAEAKQSILSGDKSGRVYRRRTVTHRASAPGEAPASDTGRLVNSINGTYDATDAAAVITAGGGVVKYARMLEFGTRLMAARPFLFPAVEKSKAWIKDRLTDAVRKGLSQ